MCGERFTVNFSICVGSGIGPRMVAPVRRAVETISLVIERLQADTDVLTVHDPGTLRGTAGCAGP